MDKCRVGSVAANAKVALNSINQSDFFILNSAYGEKIVEDFILDLDSNVGFSLDSNEEFRVMPMTSKGDRPFDFGFFSEGDEDSIVLCRQKSCWKKRLLSTSTETKLRFDMNFEHKNGALVDTGHSIWVTGGINANNQTHNGSDIYYRGQWHLGPELPLPMSHHNLLRISEDKVLLIGGKNMFIFDSIAGSWQQMASNGAEDDDKLVCGLWKPLRMVVCLAGETAQILHLRTMEWQLKASTNVNFQKGIAVGEKFFGINHQGNFVKAQIDSYSRKSGEIKFRNVKLIQRQNNETNFVHFKLTLVNKVD